MFTIKHITLSGTEIIYSGEHIRFEPEGLCVSTNPNSSSPAMVSFFHAKGHQVEIGGGTVFVMNDAGKTVARYDLGASPVPIVGDGLSDPRVRGLATASKIGVAA